MEAIDAFSKPRASSGSYNLKPRQQGGIEGQRFGSASPEPQLSSASCAVQLDQSAAARQLIASLSGTVEAGCTVLEEVRRRLRPVAVRPATATAAAASVGDFRGCLRHRDWDKGETTSSSSTDGGQADNFESVIRLTRQRLRPAAESRQPPKAEAAAAAATAAAAAADPEDEAALWGSPDFAELLRRRLRSLRPAQEAPPWMSQLAAAAGRRMLTPTAVESQLPPPLKPGDTDTDSQAGSEIVSFGRTPSTTTGDLPQHDEEAFDDDKGVDLQHCDRADGVDVSANIGANFGSTENHSEHCSEFAPRTGAAAVPEMATSPSPVRRELTGPPEAKDSAEHRPVSVQSEHETSRDSGPQPSLTSLPQFEVPPASQNTASKYLATVAAAHFERLGLASERQQQRRRLRLLQRLGPQSKLGLVEAGGSAAERLSGSSSQDDEVPQLS